MDNEIKQFSFDGAEFPVIQTDQLPSGEGIAVATVSKHLGLDPVGQRQAIERRPWSETRKCVIHFQLPGDTQRRQVFFLDADRFAMWMATIDTSRIKNEDAKQRIIKWQNEAADALNSYLRTGVALDQTSGRFTKEQLEAEVERRLEINTYKEVVRDVINAVDDAKPGDYGRIRNTIYIWLTGMNATGLRTSGREIQMWPRTRRNGPTQEDFNNASNFLTVVERKRLNALLKITDGIRDAKEMTSIRDLEEVLTKASQVLDSL
jgi:hypothetical protein